MLRAGTVDGEPAVGVRAPQQPGGVLAVGVGHAQARVGYEVVMASSPAR